MPMFQYECEECAHLFERYVSQRKGEERIACPKCNKKRTKKIISAFCSISGSSKASKSG